MVFPVIVYSKQATVNPPRPGLAPAARLPVLIGLHYISRNCENSRPREKTPQIGQA